MSTGWQRITHDLKNRHHIDAYSLAAVAFALAVLSLIPNVVPDPLRWAALLAGVGLLVWRITIPEGSTGSFDELLSDRFAFDQKPLSERLKNATEIWIFAPTAVNFLSAHNCELLRKEVLDMPDGIVRIVVLDINERARPYISPGGSLDDSLDYPVQDFTDLPFQATMRQLGAMASWHDPRQFRLSAARL